MRNWRAEYVPYTNASGSAQPLNPCRAVRALQIPRRNRKRIPGAKTALPVAGGQQRRPEVSALLLLSEERPDLTAAAAQFALPGDGWQTRDYSPLLDRITPGSRWQFRLCANPTYSVPAGPGQRGRVCAHSTVEHQLQWLMGQSDKHGFLLEPDGFTVTGAKWYRFRKGGKGRNVTFLAVTYDGILEVRDPVRFREALCRGIGPGKAYGAGLMTIVRPGGAHG